MINRISFADIFDVWSRRLWPNRTSEITPTSAMTYIGGYDYENMEGEPTFFGYFIDGALVGVNSGHKTMNYTYRSRGLYVFPEHRGKGIGVELLLATIKQAKVENCSMCWSYPRYTSWPTYQKAGFVLTSDWEKSETSDRNAYCMIKL